MILLYIVFLTILLRFFLNIALDEILCYTYYEVNALERILIVEDDVIIGGGIKHFLDGRGYESVIAETIGQARKMLETHFDLILLDINLPDGSGLEFCAEIRCDNAIPIIFLTANDTEENMIEGFRRGCDDYIAKPFSVELLYRRIAAVLRRSYTDREKEIFSYKELSVDFSRMQASISEVPVKLSATEYKLLELLIRNKGQVLTRSTILEKIWDCNENYIDENTLNVHIRRLRSKIEKDPKNPRFIITVFGIGYTFGE